MGTERRRLAVVGHPIAHSRSPAMHNAALAATGLAGEWTYEAIDMAPGEFADRTRALPADGFVGVNVTVPHKHAALALADRASDAAARIGAANTLSFTADGIAADNTDAPGFLAALPSPPDGARALVLGAGGSARAVVWALVGAGAEVWVWNRTAERAERLAAELGAAALAAEGELPAHEFELLVNTTSVGMERPADAGDPGGGSELEALRLAADAFHPGQLVVDLTYGSDDTELVRSARSRGAATIGGLEILVRQGAVSFRIWTGVEPPLEAMRAAVHNS